MANPVFPNFRPSEGKKSGDDGKGPQAQQQQPPRQAPPVAPQGPNQYQQYWQGPQVHPSAPQQQQGRAPVGHGHRRQT